MRSWLIVGLAGLLAVGTACTGGSEDEAAEATDYLSTSESWQRVGRDIRENGADFGPYQSEPIDIEANGDYVLLFGPLTDEDAANAANGSFNGLSFPSDVVGRFEGSALTADAEVVEVRGSPYLSVPLTVANFKAVYRDLTAWAQ